MLVQGQGTRRILTNEGPPICAPGKSLQISTPSSSAEEISEAYKNVEDVVDVMHEAGITRKVAKLEPLCVVKG